MQWAILHYCGTGGAASSSGLHNAQNVMEMLSVYIT